MADVWDQLKRVSWASTLVLMSLHLAGLGLRGWRWWYTFPPPKKRGEFAAAQQALAMGYALNNLAPRVGELGRIYAVSRTTGRDLASLTSTVVLDRFLFDLVMMLGLFSFAMIGYRDELESLIPHASRTFLPLTAIFLSGCVALVLLAVKPQWIRRLLIALGCRRLGFIWSHLDRLIEQLSVGCRVIKEPRTYLPMTVQSLLLWSVYVGMFFFGLHVFDIHPSFSQGLMIFSVSTLGIVLPSPGAVGTYHFFAQMALIGLAGVDSVMAAACATYLHGVGYVTMTSVGAISFLFYRHARKRDKGEQPAGCSAGLQETGATGPAPANGLNSCDNVKDEGP